MASIVNRSIIGRVNRKPDVFLSHSSRDKDVVRKLAEDLAFCEVDAWFDEWEIQVGDSLYDVITRALEKSRYIGIVLADHFDDSCYASDEMKQALTRERREDRIVLLPLLFGNIDIPAFLEDKLYLDFRSHYHHAVVQLAGIVHNIPKQHVEESIRALNPRDIRSTIKTLRYAGKEPYVVMSQEDCSAIHSSGGQRGGEGKFRFSPEAVAQNPTISPRLQKMMERLIDEVW